MCVGGREGGEGACACGCALMPAELHVPFLIVVSVIEGAVCW